jgi:hypothetical protein
MSNASAKSRLIAVATIIGLRKSVEILHEQLIQAILTAPAENVVSEMRKALGIHEPEPLARRIPLKKVTLMKPVNVLPLPAPEGALRLEQAGGYTILHLPDGRRWQSKRKRDLILRARKQGFNVQNITPY